MFSKQDYVKYFLQIRKVETTVHDKFTAFAAAVDDPELKKFFSGMARQESAHSRIVDGMLTSFGYKEK